MSHHPLAAALLAVLIGSSIPLAAADGHAGHDHGAHGAVAALGTLDISGSKLAVSAAGEPTDGAAWHVEVRLEAGTSVPKAIRMWVGAENGRGSVKAKAELMKDVAGAFSAHVEIPSPLPADARLWIAIESDQGQNAKGSLALRAAAPLFVPGGAHSH